MKLKPRTVRLRLGRKRKRWRVVPAQRQHQGRTVRWGLALARDKRRLWLCPHQHRDPRESRQCPEARLTVLWLESL